jgi:hypothetical protein
MEMISKDKKYFLRKLKRGWGMVFRFRSLYIGLISLGLLGYLWMNPQPMGDLPFSRPMFGNMLRKSFAVGVSVWCLIWFLDFGRRYQSIEDEHSPFEIWVYVGFLLIGIVTVIWLWVDRS